MVTDFRMAEALAIQKMLGDNGPLWITEQLGALANVGDTAGVERFQQIAACYEQLILARRQ